MNDTSTLQTDGKRILRAVWKSTVPWLVIAGVQMAAGLLLALAHKRGLIDAEGMIRGVMVLIGLGLAASGNRIPKSTDGLPPHTLELAALKQKILRAVGWALTLGGLAFAGLSAFTPIEFVAPAATIVLGASLAVGLGFMAWWIHVYHRTHEQ